MLTLSPVEESILQRTFALGLMQAGLALAGMTGQEIIVASPDVRRCTPAEVIAMAGGADRVVVGIYLGITGSLSGHALLMLPPDGARDLARILLEGVGEEMPDADEPVDPTRPFELDPLSMSALMEVGNVTISAFLNELGMHLHEPVMPTVPQVVVEMAGAILDTVLVDLSMDSDQVLAARAVFIRGYNAIEGALLILPRAESVATLLSALGVNG